MATLNDAIAKLSNRRVKNIRPLIPPQILCEDYPLTLHAAATIIEGRRGVEAILRGDDDRLMVVVGPCSVHDVKAALEYAEKLKAYAIEAKEDLHIVMRVYFEKPRTTVGWKGLINDPLMNNSFNINQGLRTARKLLLDIAELGLPSACEFLDTITPQYISDLVSWGAIGARTTESQVHRELTSALSMPVGFKLDRRQCWYRRRCLRSGQERPLLPQCGPRRPQQYRRDGGQPLYAHHLARWSPGPQLRS